MSGKLLAFSAVILLFSSFSYHTVDRFSTTTGLSITLVIARVLPIALVALICLLAVPVRRYVDLIKTLGTPPFVFWNWYAAVAAISGIVSGVAPAWSAWKCIEIFVVVLWAASISVHVQRSKSPRILEDTFTLLVVACYAVAVWSLSEVFREGESLRDYVLRGGRLETTWPHINSITLSVMSLFAITGGILITNRIKFPVRIAIMLPPFLAFALSRSRTGLLALLVLAAFAMLTSTISRSKKIILVFLCVGIVGVLATNPDLREWMRIDSWEELARGAGRIRTADGTQSGWLDTLKIVEKSPAIGVGFVIVRRFLDDDHAAVDNFVLQSMVAAGLIGALPMVLWAFYAFLRWLFKVRSRDPNMKLVSEMGLVATCLAFVKSFTTNGISALDFSLIAFLLGVLVLRFLLSRDGPPAVERPERETLAPVHAN